ncbi:hypothetical protein B9Z55_017906 [Caenorhabditis nigoni]|uniref:7TM GPCR serpentine receptor class x (Srx) domain-containing protein n=2 Tax=Caenorhabditis nigoni TaxID=1611254 RepID=A0A2G5TBM4_9PELO|nr:hypothetical protein B9Z55_017906 [Caenorhabditis nigoni]
MSYSYFHTPQFLSTSLHIMTSFEIPVHILGVYMILSETPEAMKSVKWSMFNMHFWCMSLDLTISLLTTPFILFPTIAGYPMGLLEWFGVDVPTQAYFGVSMFAVAGIAVLGIFENRFFVLMAENTIWKYIRIPFFVINYLACLLFFIPPYLDIPNQDMARKIVLKVFHKDVLK